MSIGSVGVVLLTQRVAACLCFTSEACVLFGFGLVVLCRPVKDFSTVRIGSRLVLGAGCGVLATLRVGQWACRDDGVRPRLVNALPAQKVFGSEILSAHRVLLSKCREVVGVVKLRRQVNLNG